MRPVVPASSVVVTGCPRADLADVDRLAGFGVATVHEAIGRGGYFGPGIRPVYLGSRIGGTAVTVVCWPGDNLMIHAAVEQRGPAWRSRDAGHRAGEREAGGAGAGGGYGAC